MFVVWALPITIKALLLSLKVSFFFLLRNVHLLVFCFPQSQTSSKFCWAQTKWLEKQLISVAPSNDFVWHIPINFHCSVIVFGFMNFSSLEPQNFVLKCLLWAVNEFTLESEEEVKYKVYHYVNCIVKARIWKLEKKGLLELLHPSRFFFLHFKHKENGIKLRFLTHRYCGSLECLFT